MSVLVRGMEMPKNCAECRFCVNGFTDDAPMYECACQSYDNVSVLVDKDGQPFDFRPDWCPLIEVQTPHGRLIEADALKETIDYYISEAGWSDAHNEALGWVKEFIDNEKAVIGAEGSEE